MSTSAIGAASANPIHHHGHHSRPATTASATSPASDLLAPADGSNSATGATGKTADASPTAGLQKFAAELQSILISAQSRQANAAPTTASDPATAADPNGATDPSAPSKPGGHAVRHLADRLQDLLAAGGGTAQAGSTSTASGANQPVSLQSVLDRLQSTLQQTLQSYGKDAAKTATTSLTA